mmetsp:Transcript_59326/g.129953  ORF Transcript_59326/g.129953 Transcript_59326/m.129953 type:complete len:281 (-) Transcript_59326:9-851(-)
MCTVSTDAPILMVEWMHPWMCREVKSPITSLSNTTRCPVVRFTTKRAKVGGVLGMGCLDSQPGYNLSFHARWLLIHWDTLSIAIPSFRLASGWLFWQASLTLILGAAVDSLAVSSTSKNCRHSPVTTVASGRAPEKSRVIALMNKFKRCPTNSRICLGSREVVALTSYRCLPRGDCSRGDDGEWENIPSKARPSWLAPAFRLALYNCMTSSTPSPRISSLVSFESSCSPSRLAKVSHTAWAAWSGTPAALTPVSQAEYGTSVSSSFILEETESKAVATVC